MFEKRKEKKKRVNYFYLFLRKFMFSTICNFIFNTKNRKISKLQEEGAFLVFILAHSSMFFLSNIRTFTRTCAQHRSKLYFHLRRWLLLLLLMLNKIPATSDCGRSDWTKFDLDLVAIFLAFQQYVNMRTNFFFIALIEINKWYIYHLNLTQFCNQFRSKCPLLSNAMYRRVICL